MTSFVFRETLMTHLLLWGNAFAQIIRNGRGQVVALYPLMPDRMEVCRDGDGEIYYLYTKATDENRGLSSQVQHLREIGFIWCSVTKTFSWTQVQLINFLLDIFF